MQKPIIISLIHLDLPSPGPSHFILCSRKLLVNSNSLPSPCFCPCSRTLLEKNTIMHTSLMLDMGSQASSDPLVLPARILYFQVLALTYVPDNSHLFLLFTSPSPAYPSSLSVDDLASCNTENWRNWWRLCNLPPPHLSTYQHVCNYHTPCITSCG